MEIVLPLQLKTDLGVWSPMPNWSTLPSPKEKILSSWMWAIQMEGLPARAKVLWADIFSCLSSLISQEHKFVPFAYTNAALAISELMGSATPASHIKSQLRETIKPLSERLIAMRDADEDCKDVDLTDLGSRRYKAGQEVLLIFSELLLNLHIPPSTFPSFRIPLISP